MTDPKDIEIAKLKGQIEGLEKALDLIRSLLLVQSIPVLQPIPQIQPSPWIVPQLPWQPYEPYFTICTN